MFACLHGANGAALERLAQDFSPCVERTSADTVVFDADGLDRIFGMPHEIAAALVRRLHDAGLEARIAIASNSDTAAYAARGFAGISIVPHGDEAKYLETLPVSLLGLSPEIEETLEQWGIRRFRDLAALPEIGLAERLGEEGVRLRLLARGEVERPLVPIDEPLEFVEQFELEYPVDQLEPLAFLLARLLNALCTRLANRGLATHELRLRLKLEDQSEHQRVLRLPVPTLDARSLLKLMQLDLSAHPPAASVMQFWLEAIPARPRVAQEGLFVPIAPEPEKLELMLARLKGIVGEDNVGSAELLDTHRPDAFRMRAFVPAPAQGKTAVADEAPGRLAMRVFRPPKPARVEMTAGRPAHLSAEGVRGTVVSFAGPWRTSGDWWLADAWMRDEWDVMLHDGALYRIYCDHRNGRWFVEGSYD